MYIHTIVDGSERHSSINSKTAMQKPNAKGKVIVMDMADSVSRTSSSLSSPLGFRVRARVQGWGLGLGLGCRV